MLIHRRCARPLALACTMAAVTLAPAAAQARPLIDPPAAADSASGVRDSGDDIVLRRDGSKAVAFEPYPGPSATATFDWGDAGLGALAGAIVVVLGATGAFSLRGRQVAPVSRRRADDAV